jgi:hypothetical protein
VIRLFKRSESCNKSKQLRRPQEKKRLREMTRLKKRNKFSLKQKQRPSLMLNRGLLKSGRKKWKGKMPKGRLTKRINKELKLWRVNRRDSRRRPKLLRQDKERNKSSLSSAKSSKKKSISQNSNV